MPMSEGFIARLGARWTRWRLLRHGDPSQEQLALLIRAAWISKRRYRTTCWSDPSKARRTWRRAVRVYLTRRRGVPNGIPREAVRAPYWCRSDLRRRA